MVKKPKVNDGQFIRPSCTVNPSKSSYIASIPLGLTLITDTREQLPYKFKGIPNVVHKLTSGDYSIKGMESMVSIERKSQSDFYGTITKGRDRFKRMLQRMADSNTEFKGMVIECTEEQLMTPETSYSNIHINSVYATIIAFEVKHNLHIYYGSRAECEQKVINWLVYFYKMKRGG